MPRSRYTLYAVASLSMEGLNIFLAGIYSILPSSIDSPNFISKRYSLAAFNQNTVLIFHENLSSQIQHQLPCQPFPLHGVLNESEGVPAGEKDERAPSPCFVQRLTTRLLPLFLANLSLTVRRNTMLQLVAGQCFDDVIRHLAEIHLDLRQQK